MLPYLLFGSVKVSMLGIGIVVSLITFLYSAYRYCMANQLDFKQLFFSLPYMFLIVYLLGKYSEYYLVTKDFLPLSPTVWGYIASPNGIGFHYSGIIIGAIIALLVFFFNKNKNDIKKIIDMLFFSTMWMVMVLGVFLILSDEVIGQPNDGGRFAIRSLIADSKIQQYGQVYPYGIIVSLIAFVSYVATKIRVRFTSRTGSGYLGYALFFILLSFSFSYQLYPKYLVSDFLGINRDIKHYINIILIIVCSLEYYKLTSNK